MEEKKNKWRFSRGWFLAGMSIHFFGCLVLAVLTYGAVMSAFTESASSVQATLDVLGIIAGVWILVPWLLGVLLELDIKGLLPLVLLWSVTIGVAAGYIMPRLIKGKNRC